MTRKLYISLLLAAVLLVMRTLPAGAQSCAMCGSALVNDPLGRAISWSILFMMATPYTIVGAAAAWLFYMHRRAAGRRRDNVIDLAEAARHRPPVKA